MSMDVRLKLSCVYSQDVTNSIISRDAKKDRVQIVYDLVHSKHQDWTCIFVVPRNHVLLNHPARRQGQVGPGQVPWSIEKNHSVCELTATSGFVA